MWPEKVLVQFQMIALKESESENDIFGPYNKLLYTLSPPDSDFTVVPQCFPNPILAIARLSSRSSLTKQEADRQLRRRMGGSCASCPLRTLHAVSVMGTRLCFYCVGTQDSDGKIITPIAIPDNPLKVIDNVPSNRWELDILEPAGEAQFREIILDGCHALDAFRSHRYDLYT